MQYLTEDVVKQMKENPLKLHRLHIGTIDLASVYPQIQ